MRPDVVVIGAGVIGSAITYQLAKGGVKVMAFDRGEVGGEATRASAGMIMPHHNRSTPMAYSTLETESSRLFAALADELRERTGMDVGYRPAGLLRVAFDETEEQTLRLERAAQVEAGRVVSWLEPRAALDIEPLLNPRARAAIYYADDHQVEPRVLAQALMRAAVDRGAVLRERAAVDRLLIEGDRVVGVALTDETVQAREVVIANGAWAGAWATALKTPIPIRPVRGQVVALRTPGTSVRAVVNGGDGWLLTKASGLIYAGTTVEDVGFDPRPTAEGVAGILSHVPRLVPRLSDATFSHAWAGLRPGSADDLPLLGRLPGWRGVSLAGGHFRNGIMLAPITGELMADLLAGRRPRLPLDAFDPARFLVRAA
jgi:glycine oxidase